MKRVGRAAPKIGGLHKGLSVHTGIDLGAAMPLCRHELDPRTCATCREEERLSRIYDARRVRAVRDPAPTKSSVSGLPDELAWRDDQASIAWLREWDAQRLGGTDQTHVVQPSMREWPSLPSPFDWAAGLLAWIGLTDRRPPARLPELSNVLTAHKPFWVGQHPLRNFMKLPVRTLAVAGRKGARDLRDLVDTALIAYQDDEPALRCGQIIEAVWSSVNLAFDVPDEVGDTDLRTCLTRG